MSKEKIKVVSIIGPTASGKTKLSIELAKMFNAEIVSVDSIQIYKEFNILSAKPDKKDLSSVPHHLINFLSVEETFSVAKFIKLAHDCISDIQKRSKIPFLVGGTGLYLDSLIKNRNYDIAVNSEKNENLKFLSNKELMDVLLKIDEKSAKKIHINDSKRLLRAVEFFYNTGYPISEQVERSLKSESLYKVCKIGLNFSDRELLYNRINSRVDEMFEKGIVEEVLYLHRNKYLSKTAQAAIGYKELLDYINSKETLENTRENLKRSTRRYAKRQLTWFRRDSEINWIYVDNYTDFSGVISSAKDVIKKFIDE